MFAKVPAKNGVPQIGKVRLISGTSISDTEAICEIVGELQEGWVELSEEEYLALGGVIPQPIVPVPSQEQRIAQLEQVVDVMLQGGATI